MVRASREMQDGSTGGGRAVTPRMTRNSASLQSLEVQCSQCVCPYEKSSLQDDFPLLKHPCFVARRCELPRSGEPTPLELFRIRDSERRVWQLLVSSTGALHRDAWLTHSVRKPLLCPRRRAFHRATRSCCSQAAQTQTNKTP